MEERQIYDFSKLTKELIANTIESWNENSYGFGFLTSSSYSKEDINRIIYQTGSTAEQIQEKVKLSTEFFNISTTYKALNYYLASIIDYNGMVIPVPKSNELIDSKNNIKKYRRAIEFVDKNNLQELCFKFTLQTLVKGSYFGLVQPVVDDHLVIIDLPNEYCRSNFRTKTNIPVIEFNVTFFDQIDNEHNRRVALKSYPKFVRNYYRRYVQGKVDGPWVIVPSEMGVYFSFNNFASTPLLLDSILPIVQYDETVNVLQKHEKDKIKTILVQKVPHLNDGTLVFQPIEAAEMHKGASQMLQKKNPDTSVLTTYADVDAIKPTADQTQNKILENMNQNIFNKARVSGQIFAPTGGQSLMVSIQNDISLVNILVKQYNNFFSRLLTQTFGNSVFEFKYKILLVGAYNRSQFITDSLKNAQYGYSLLMPGMADGLSQLEFENLKDLENSVLDLGHKLIPLNSSFTQSSDSASTAENTNEKPLEEKSEKTIQNLESIDNQ